MINITHGRARPVGCLFFRSKMEQDAFHILPIAWQLRRNAKAKAQTHRRGKP